MIHAQESAVINARPEDVYAVIADYHVGHKAILPQPWFEEMIVEEGGQGEGTIIRIRVNVWGQITHYRQIVSEPEPGRVLVEKDMHSDQLTRFVFEPLNNGAQTRVTIASQFPVEAGIMGLMQRLTQAPIARRMYRRELNNLEEYMKQQVKQPAY